MNNNNQEFYIDREEGYFIAIVGSSGWVRVLYFL